MHCTQCKQESLEPSELETGLVAAKCSSCDGVLLPLMNYRYWADNQPQVELTEVELSETEAVKDSTGAKICPKCTKLMLKFRLGLESENRLDVCGHCDEVWLDKDEWLLVKKLDLHKTLPKVFTEAWQKNIRKQKEAKSLREYFSGLIGSDDFSKIEEFKSWLDDHPKKTDIKHFINTNFD